MTAGQASIIAIQIRNVKDEPPEMQNVGFDEAP